MKRKIVHAYGPHMVALHPELAHVTHKYNRRCMCDGCFDERGVRIGRWLIILLGLFVLCMTLSTLVTLGRVL